MRFIPIILLLFIGACSDSSTNSVEDEAPTIPNVSETFPTFDYFNAKINAEQSIFGYQIAAALTSSVEGIMTGFASLPSSFMGSGNGQNASFDNDTWRWEYTSSGAGASVSIVLTAQVLTNETEWEMLISASSPEISFQDYKFLDGTVSNSSNEGTWNFYSFDEQSNDPVLSYNWDITNSDQAEFTFDFGDFDYTGMNYIKNSPDNTISITNDDNSTITIYWNTDTGTGYYQETGEERLCWDQSRSSTVCS